MVELATGWLSFQNVNLAVQVMVVVPNSPSLLVKFVPSEKV